MITNENEILEIINRETTAWNSKDVELLLSIFHPDMVWVWPKTNKDHNPIDWEIKLGKYDYERWKNFYANFFSQNILVNNIRNIISIKLSREGDGAFAVVDIDTLWENIITKERNHWLGRVCKVYTKKDAGWKLIMHTGVLVY